jgi:hypothetical protein
MPFLALSQTFVSTTPENKNVVLEEFTGIYCGFCPDGHVLAQALHTAYPNDVFIIKIHTGGYANPSGPSDPDFRTIYGGAIAAASGLAGYPAGTINRSTFSSIAPQSGAPGSTALSRGDWAAAAALIMADPSEVNVAAQASYDMGTGILTVNTESYFTGAGTSGTYNLHVAVVMNNVAGPQSGASNYNPGAIIPGPWSPTYNHQQMMVHLMDGATGLAFTSSTAGTFVPNTHTWSVPAQMQGDGSGSTTGFFPDHDPTNFDVVAYITESATNTIVTGFQAVVIPIFPNQYDANVTASSANDVICAIATDIGVTFRNYGSDTLTSLDLTYDINGGTPATYNWTGNMASGATETVSITNVSFTPQASNTVNWVASNPNGQVDQNLTNNTSTTSFTHWDLNGDVINGIGAGTINVSLLTDGYGSETTWDIKDESGNVLGSGGPYGNNQQINETAIVAAQECYIFTLYDSYGDGMCCTYGVGQALITDGSGNIIFEGTPTNLQNFTEIGQAFHTDGYNGMSLDWECSPFGCVEGTPGLGTFFTQSQCESDPTNGCYVGPAWDCDPTVGCIDVGVGGTGTYNSEQECLDDSNPCGGPINGCTDPVALNYNSNATLDDGSCTYSPSCDTNCFNQLCPSPNDSLDDGFVGLSYQSFISVNIPFDTIVNLSGLTLNATVGDFQITDILGLPNNFSYSCPFPSCLFTGGTSGCIDIFSIFPPQNSDIGLYTVQILTSTLFINVPLLGTITQLDTFNYYIEIDSLIISGCTDSLALNFDSLASIDDGSCLYLLGCTDSLANNFNQDAIVNDGSCLYCDLSTTIVSSSPSSPSLCDGFGISSSTSSFPIISYSWITSQGLLVSSNDIAFNLCTEGYIITVNDSLGCSTVDSLVLGNVYGCTNPSSFNFSWPATIDDGSCIAITYGCINPIALNFDSTANVDDGSCCLSSFVQVGLDINGESFLNYSGKSVSLSGDGNNVAIGSPNSYYGSRGHVRLYTKISNPSLGTFSWTQVGQIINGEFYGDQSGTSVSLSDDGNTVAIGAPYNDNNNGNGYNSGHVRLYTKISNPSLGTFSWTQIGQDIDGENNNDNSGHSVSLSGDGNSVAIGAPYNSGNGNQSGHVRLYTKISNPSLGTFSWTQIGQDIDGENNNDNSGHSVSLSDNGNTVAIGAINNDANGNSAGHVRVFENISGYWIQIGQDIDGEYSGDHSGHSVSLSGDGNTVAIGATSNDGNGNNSGHVRIYENISGTWIQIGRDLDGEAANDNSGYSVSLNNNGNTVAIGGIYNDGNGNSTGHVRLYTNISYPLLGTFSWTQIGNDIDGEHPNDRSGYSVSINNVGNTVAIGAPYNAGIGGGVNGIQNGGHVRIYDLGSSNCSGCIDPLALNYDSTMQYDDGSCAYYTGCTDLLAFNYDSSAIIDDGSCMYCDITNTLLVSNNTPGSCNGFILANTSSSNLPISYLWSNGSTQNNILGLCSGLYTVIITDNVGCTIEDTAVMGTISGCTDPLAYNFNSYATVDDGSCLYCDLTNTFLVNNNTAGNCNGFIIANSSSSNLPISYLWSNGSSQNNIVGLCSGVYSVIITDNVGCIIEDTVYMGLIPGCMDPLALNYDPTATVDDGSCTYSSNCTSPKPNGLYAYDVIDTRAKVGWNNMNDVNCMVWKYFVRYREVGTLSWNTKSAGVGNGLCNFGLNTVNKQLLNLTPSTTYEFRMKAFYCGGTSSNYSTPVQFTTADVCPDMTNLSVQTFTNNTSKAKFTWDTTGAYVFARITLRVDTAGANWQTAGGFGVYYPTLFVNKFGLQSGETYRAQGRTFCHPSITAYRSPTWTAPVFWTQPGTIRLEGGTSINNLDIYPNPSRDVFNISFNSDDIQDLSIRILNVIGAEVYREDKQNFIGEYIKQISIENYGKGIYFLEIETNSGIVNKKLILQ